jgi:hypothetical protein
MGLIGTVLSWIAIVSLLLECSIGAMIVTCHNDDECGSVCGRFSSDIAAPSEGLFGTSCSCQSGGLCNRCYALGQNIQVCCDYQPPACKAACNQQICISKDGKQATATILSACPRNHPQNTGQCCQYQNSDYCTCVVQDTIDLNWQPYAALGNTNGYSSSVTWGGCGSQLQKLGIEIETPRATALVQPFLKSGRWCNELITGTETGVGLQCERITSKAQCASTRGCSWCNAAGDLVATQCYSAIEADVLTHVLVTEKGPGLFNCSAQNPLLVNV